MPVKLEPQANIPLPFDLDEIAESSLLEELAVTGRTAEVLEHLGAAVDVSTTPENLAAEKRLIDQAVKDGKAAPLKNSLPAALGAASFLRAYGQTLALDIATVRSALTHKLLELADCGDPKHELRAIELLGKHVDIGLFTERSEININYNTPEALENAIKDRVKRLLHQDVRELKPFTDLDLGIELEDADYEEVDPGDNSGEDDDA